MKKSLLFLTFAAFAATTNAETVVGMATTEELQAAGLSETKEYVEGGTVIVDNEAGSMALAYADEWGYAPLWTNYQKVVVAGNTEITLENGAVGSTNPGFTGYYSGVMEDGAVFVLTAKKDGWMTIFTKINPNKQYVVFEGEDAGIAYTLGVAGADYKIYYTLPSTDEGYVDLNAADASKYFLEKSRDFRPTPPYVAAGLASAPTESTGFLSFAVKADNEYYVSALGSKCSVGGFVYTDVAPAICFSAEGELAEVVFDEFSGVESVEATSADAPIYNLMGVRVNSDAKGILIQNGKKFIRK